MRFSVPSANALSSTIAAAFPTDGAPEPTAAPELVPRADATAPWVSVDDKGRPKTYTPSVTTVSGTTSLVDPARHDLTASVFTWVTYGVPHTSTGSVPNPTATGTSGQGSFSLCSNSAKDGAHVPFCHPYPDSVLLKTRTYYITWDPIYFNKTGTAKKNETALDISVRLDYRNKNDTAWLVLKTYEKVPAAWGFFPLTITNDLHKTEKTNVTITLMTSPFGHKDTKDVPYKLPVVIEDLAGPEPSKTELGIKLAIALPVIFGGIFILVIGVCIWNRKTRRIQLGNIMSRSRHGYSGRRERRQQFDNSLNTGGIQLDNGPMSPPAGGYRDEPRTRPRRDSDGLDSLAGSPVDGSFEQQGTTGGRNAFRDEMARQHAERHDDRF